MSQRIALGVRYDGARYHGWQCQQDVISVQQKVEQALSQVANHSIHLTCAGRTDARVHATSQVVHFDSDADRAEKSWVFGANSNLPADISVIWGKCVSYDFHARFSATARTYRYLIFNHNIRPGILRHAVGWYHKTLDEGRMQAAANDLVGEHDFTSFRGSGCQSKSARRCIHYIKVDRIGRMILLEIKANAFLLHMVRNIVGVLVKIGDGFKPVGWAAEVLSAKDRRAAAMTISPNGLYLVKVDYPELFDLPEAPVGPFFLG